MITQTKICTKCGLEKLATLKFFYRLKTGKYGLHPECKDCQSKRSKKHYIQNQEAIKKRSKKYYEENKDVVTECNKRWRKDNPEKVKICNEKHYINNIEKIKARAKKWEDDNRTAVNERRRKWRKANPEISQKYNRKTRTTPQGRLSDRMGPAIRLALKGNKNGRSWELLIGYTCNDLREHLERLFIDDMSWNNIGKWHIDHIIPKSLFNYKVPENEEFQKCWALSNLQPLWAIDNLEKGNKLLGAVA